MKCVDIKELGQFLKGTLAPQRLLEIDEHIRACNECQNAVSKMSAKSMSEFSMKLMDVAVCPEYEVLSDYIDEALDSVESKAISTHIISCDLCHRDVERMKELRAHAQLRGEILVAPKTTKRGSFVEWFSWKVALAGTGAVAAVLIGVVFYSNINKPVDNTPVVNIARNPEVVKPNLPAVTVKPDVIKPNITVNKPRPIVAVNPKPAPVKQVVAKVLLNDGSLKVIKKDGKTLVESSRGSIDPGISSKIYQKLRTGKVKQSEPVRVAMNNIYMRGDESYSVPATAPKPLSPVGKIILSNKPVFKWSKVDLAESYQVVVTDESGNKVFEQITDKNSLVVGSGLERGHVYFWRVGVRFGEADTWAMSRGVGFKVLSAEFMAEIQSVKAQMPGSRLALAVVYESMGLDDEAKIEYAALAKSNPGSNLLSKIRK